MKLLLHTSGSVLSRFFLVFELNFSLAFFPIFRLPPVTRDLCRHQISRYHMMRQSTHPHSHSTALAGGRPAARMNRIDQEAVARSATTKKAADGRCCSCWWRRWPMGGQFAGCQNSHRFPLANCQLPLAQNWPFLLSASSEFSATKSEKFLPSL